MGYIFLVGIVIFLIIAAIFLFVKTDEDKEKERKMEANLADEFIYDPVTGTKITLEQAETGEWTPDAHEFRLKTKEESEQFITEDEIKSEEAMEYIRGAGFQVSQLSDLQIETLNNTQILVKYAKWDSPNVFSFNEGRDYVFFPAVELNYMVYRQVRTVGAELMFWVKINNTSGHYYMREKTNTEKAIELILNMGDIKMPHYEVYTIEKAVDVDHITRILECFDKEKNLEIEINEDNLFIKTLNLLNVEDIVRIEKIIQF